MPHAPSRCVAAFSPSPLRPRSRCSTLASSDVVVSAHRCLYPRFFLPSFPEFFPPHRPVPICLLYDPPDFAPTVTSSWSPKKKVHLLAVRGSRVMPLLIVTSPSSLPFSLLDLSLPPCAPCRSCFPAPSSILFAFRVVVSSFCNNGIPVQTRIVQRGAELAVQGRPEFHCSFQRLRKGRLPPLLPPPPTCPNTRPCPISSAYSP